MDSPSMKICANCGFRSSRSFPGHICPVCKVTDWKCTACAFTRSGQAPPPVCPECGRRGTFLNITPYIPDWFSAPAGKEPAPLR